LASGMQAFGVKPSLPLCAPWVSSLEEHWRGLSGVNVGTQPGADLAPGFGVKPHADCRPVKMGIPIENCFQYW